LSYTLSDGVHTYEHTVNPLRDVTGRITGIVSAAYDVTPLQQLQERVARDEANFRAVLRHSPVVMGHVDASLCYTWLYQSVAPEIDTDSLIGMPVRGFILDKEGQRLRALCARALETGEGTRSEYPVTVDERVYYVDTQVEPLRADNGAVVGVSFFTLDVTERKRMEQRLRENTQNIQQILDISKVLMGCTDRDGRYTWFYQTINPTFPREAALGVVAGTLMTWPDGPNRMLAAVQRVIDSGQAVRMEVDCLWNDLPVAMDVLVEPLRNENSAITGASIFAIEVSNWRALERDLVRTSGGFALRWMLQASAWAVLTATCATPGRIPAATSGRTTRPSLAGATARSWGPRPVLQSRRSNVRRWTGRRTRRASLQSTAATARAPSAVCSSQSATSRGR
jgi:PAS domain S-box-containing protein